MESLQELLLQHDDPIHWEYPPEFSLLPMCCVMMQASLIKYLKTAQLGPFARSCSFDDVLQVLGPPPYWDGLNHIPYSESTIWLYETIQFNFDAHGRLADTHIVFESTYDGTSVKYLDWVDSFIQFDDLDVYALSTPDRFQNTMAANKIGIVQHSLSGARVVINTFAGVQARFATMTDFNAAVNGERRIATNEPYLHRVTTVVLA